MESENVTNREKMDSMHGLVANIEPFAVFDGPGIRTVVFMKGCPLKCIWCSSPHTQNGVMEVLNDTDKCRKCGACIEVCPKKVVQTSEEDVIRIDRKLCDGCGLCAENCAYQALEMSGKRYTVEGLFHEIERDIPFYRRSNGGVTVGGGEPAMQPDFVTAFLKRCQEQHIHTAMESCALAPQETWTSIIDHLDLLYVDIKQMHEDVHKKITGASNRLILANVQIAAERVPLILRIPVIPGLNDDQDNLVRTAKFAVTLGRNLVRIELLPFHHLGEDLYRKLGRDYPLSDVHAPAEERMSDLKKFMETFGLNVQIGG